MSPALPLPAPSSRIASSAPELQQGRLERDSGEMALSRRTRHRHCPGALQTLSVQVLGPGTAQAGAGARGRQAGLARLSSWLCRPPGCSQAAAFPIRAPGMNHPLSRRLASFLASSAPGLGGPRPGPEQRRPCTPVVPGSSGGARPACGRTVGARPGQAARRTPKVACERDPHRREFGVHTGPPPRRSGPRERRASTAVSRSTSSSLGLGQFPRHDVQSQPGKGGQAPPPSPHLHP